MVQKEIQCNQEILLYKTEEDKQKGKVGEPFKIDQDKCIKCASCYEACPKDAVKRTSEK